MTTTNSSAGQTSSGIALSSGDTLNASEGGTADGTVISSGDLEIVLAGGSASGTQVNSGEALLVPSDGSAITPVSADGLVLSTGLALEQSGDCITGAGSTAISAVIGAGEIEFVPAGGVASATTVSNGGSVVVFGGLTETSRN